MMYTTIKDLDVAGKAVVLRLDLNLPMQDGVVADMTRFERSLPTIRHIINGGGRVVILSHFGRPDGAFDSRYSFQSLVGQISAALGDECLMVQHAGLLPLPDLSRAQAEARVVLVDNTRFFPGEVSGEKNLARSFAELGDIFCLDAFSVAHRSHASVTGIASFLPACVGLALGHEIACLTEAMDSADRPIMAVVGGAKVSTKISVLKHLIDKVDHLVVGGGMANTFLLAQGHTVGKSLAEREQVPIAKGLLASAAEKGCNIVLPVDVATHGSFAATDEPGFYCVEDIPGDKMVLDFGPESLQAVADLARTCKTVLWNGPLGAFELAPFERASASLANVIAGQCRSGALRAVAGGGDTLAMLKQAGVQEDFTFCSTGGGAFLEWLEGKELPGLGSVQQQTQTRAVLSKT